MLRSCKWASTCVKECGPCHCGAEVKEVNDDCKSCIACEEPFYKLKKALENQNDKKMFGSTGKHM